ncbi:hypothetical protein STENM36S_08630 [Streptomyces tendae]
MTEHVDRSEPEAGAAPTTAAVTPADAADAARLVAFGLQPKLLPARDQEYADLLRRYREDPPFARLADAVAAGLGLVVLEVSPRAGMAVTAAEDSVFAVRMGDYARRAATDSGDRFLHGLAHLAVAAMAYPRPEDLADDGYIGRVTVNGVDAFVRQACRRLEERAEQQGENTDPATDAPGLEAAWRIWVVFAARSKAAVDLVRALHAAAAKAEDHANEEEEMVAALQEVSDAAHRDSTTAATEAQRARSEAGHLRQRLTEVEQETAEAVRAGWLDDSAPDADPARAALAASDEDDRRRLGHRPRGGPPGHRARPRGGRRREPRRTDRGPRRGRGTAAERAHEGERRTAEALAAEERLAELLGLAAGTRPGIPQPRRTPTATTGPPLPPPRTAR